MGIPSEFLAHLAGGTTTVARAWAIDRRDGARFGFTDHDRDLAFEGRVFRAETGVTASALQQTTGLAVDNTEAMGALTDAGLSEAEILAGRFDGAEVRAWMVNWREVSQRALLFRGAIGEIRRGAGAFHAELRGLTAALNVPQGRVYQTPCSAILGDAACKVDLGAPAYSAEAEVTAVSEGRILTLSGLGGYEGRWFERGRILMLDGAAAGLSGFVKVDRKSGGARVVELWQAVEAEVAPGDRIRISAGCDKRAETCRAKFGNLVNHRGFPAIPGEDWLVATPARRAGT